MNIIISNSNDSPIYEQIETQIKKAIISGKLKSGEALPSLRFLAKELRVSVISTKRAYEELERQGFIESVPGKGSFVAEKNKELIYEEYLKNIEKALETAVYYAKLANISLSELLEITDTLYQEE